MHRAVGPTLMAMTCDEQSQASSDAPDCDVVNERSAPSPSSQAFRVSMIEALARTPRITSPKWFYDERGSKLFEEICDLDEYYVTRTELAIFDACLEEVASLVGPGCVVFEPGSGEGIKTSRLLAALESPRAYVAIDVAARQLEQTAARLRRAHKGLRVASLHADFMTVRALPDFEGPPAKRLAFFPGSTLGNFEAEAALRVLRRLGELAGPRGQLLLGVDLVKDTGVLERAYDDALGVTAAFNLNLLVRMQRELDARVDVDAWSHRAIFDREESRIEMQLESKRRQTIQIGDHRFDFEAGEVIVTEYSHKYTLEGIADLTRAAGFETRRVFVDAREWFAVLLLARA